MHWMGYAACLVSSFSYCNSEFEQRCLSTIRQLTFPSMGFEKAGEAYFSSDGKNIIFQAVPEGEKLFQIFIMDLQGGIPRRVSTGKGACTCSNFRPDGKKIIFASSHESPENSRNQEQQSTEKGRYVWNLTPYMNIYEADLDGSNLVALTSGPAYHAECAYSQDGSEIVYASNQDGSMNLYIMNADGSNVRQITHTNSCYNGGPFFSPDGEKIVFRADREKPDYLQVFLINRDGLGERQLTSNQAVNWAPYWHPNGKIIAYTTSIHGHGQYEIYLLNIISGAECRLTHNTNFDGLPVFSPDGRMILWTSKRSGQTSQIFLADFTLPDELKDDI